MDFHYWPTEDIEWYDPGQVTTEGGHLVFHMVQVGCVLTQEANHLLTVYQEENHDMNFKSGMYP
jgi:hypothetical protein